MDNDDLIRKKAFKLIELHREGKLGGEKMPEDANPLLSIDSMENYLYFTLPMALNYQRDSYKLWKSALLTYEDSSTRFVFVPQEVINSEYHKVQEALTKYGIALQKNKQTDIWIKLCNTIQKEFNGDIRLLFNQFGNNIELIRHYVQVKNKKLFPYLSGKKIFNYWLYVIYQYTDREYVDISELTVAPDTHVIKASRVLGLINDEEIDKSNIQEIVVERWEFLLSDSEFNPIDIHTPLWLWSRSGFKYEL